MIDTNDIPMGVVTVPVLVDDNGTEYNTQLFAGQMAFNVSEDGLVLNPRSDWCIALDRSKQKTLLGGAAEVVGAVVKTD